LNIGVYLVLGHSRAAGFLVLGHSSMRRASLGIIAALLLLIGGVSALNGPGGSSAWGFSGVCIKSGLVLGALWLALPQIQAAFTGLPRRLLKWLLGTNNKPAEPGAASPPAIPPPRPRRRSNR
jgi:hypothetical protein